MTSHYREFKHKQESPSLFHETGFSQQTLPLRLTEGLAFAIMLLVFVLLVAGVSAQFEVPDALVEPLSPKGFRVSIPGKRKSERIDYGNLELCFLSRSRGH